MRLWHLIFAIFSCALVFALWREPVGRVALIVFVSGIGECALGLTAIMALFRHLAAIAHASRPGELVRAAGAVAFVLAAATFTMTGLLGVGIWCVLRATE